MTIAAPFFGNKKRPFKTTFEIVIEPKLNFCVLKEKWKMKLKMKIKRRLVTLAKLTKIPSH